MMQTEPAAMPPALEIALEPPVPGRLVRALAPIFPGVRRTAEQIPAFAHHWRVEAEAVLDDDGDDRPIMVVLGDSLSQAIGASSVQRTWLHRLVLHDAQQRRTRPARIVNLSRSGAKIDDVLAVQLPALRAIGRPVRLVTCTVGSNDFASGGSFSRVESSMHSLMARLPAEAVLATLPANGSMMAKRLNRTIRSEGGASGLAIADVAAHLPTWRGRSAGDRFHPNDRGYESWFQAFAEVTPPGTAGMSRVGEPARVER